MTEFTVRLFGGRGTLLVDGREPDLFGELVGCQIRRDVPLEFPGPAANPTALGPFHRDPSVEVTLRLSLESSDRFTLVRDASIETIHGPTREIRSSGPGAVALLDRWLEAHPDEPGGALIAKARELLTGNPA